MQRAVKVSQLYLRNVYYTELNRKYNEDGTLQSNVICLRASQCLLGIFTQLSVRLVLLVPQLSVQGRWVLNERHVGSRLGNFALV